MSLPTEELAKYKSLQLIFGPMRSGKTFDLLARVVHLERIFKRSVLLVRLRNWHREGIDVPGLVSSRNESFSHSCVEIDSIDEIDCDAYDVYAFDEGSFLPDLDVLCRKLLFEKNKMVIVALLNGSYEQKQLPNDMLGKLLPMATHVTFSTAVCEKCRSKAVYSIKKELKSDTIPLGKSELIEKGDEQYDVRCVNCI